MISQVVSNILNFKNLLYQNVETYASQTYDVLIIILISLGAVGLFFVIIGLLYLISILRRTNVVMKKVDYFMEDITYKSESLNVTVETLNKLSNYLLLFDSSSKNGIKAVIRLLSENRNYFYSFADKLRENVDKKISKTDPKKQTTEKTTKAKTETASKVKKPAAKSKDIPPKVKKND